MGLLAICARRPWSVPMGRSTGIVFRVSIRPSIFAAILDDAKGGRFQIAPTMRGLRHKQFYWPDTNVLVTRFLSPDGVGQITDFMPVGVSEAEPGHQWLVRRVNVVRGSMTFRLACCPAFNYARDPHQTVIFSGGACFHAAGLNLELATRVPLKQDGSSVFAEFTLPEGEAAVFVLRQMQPARGCSPLLSDAETHTLFHHTVDYWRRWLAKCSYRGRWREMVHRSALVLKLLTYEPTGAIVAAPTTSLPEELGGGRNWDYRYTWIRDTSFTLYALLRIGFTAEAGEFMHWLEARCHEIEPDGSLQIMYGIDGRHTLEVRKSWPIWKAIRARIPYASAMLPTSSCNWIFYYGELMDSVYLYNKYGTPISYDLWTYLRQLVNWVCDNWQRKDDGIWEVRGGQQHFVYSKMMCWVAVDRGLRLADRRSFPADRERWLNIRDRVYEDIMAQGWHPRLQAFVQHYGSAALDAANLLMPLVFFLSPPTHACSRRSTPSILRHRAAAWCRIVWSIAITFSKPQMVWTMEGSFNMCTFWLVEALTAGPERPIVLNSRGAAGV